MSEKTTTTNTNETRETKNRESREKFYLAFKKAFDTKTVAAEADSGDWKPEFQYVHIFQKDVKHQLFYYQYTGSTMYFVANPEVAAEVAEDPFFTKIQPVLKKDPKTGERTRHTQTKLYVDFTDIKEVAKCAKRITAAAQKVAKDQQTKKSK